jgi:hypothetical protein
MLAAGISRRDVLRLTAAGAAVSASAAVWPLSSVRAGAPSLTLPPYGFLNSDELAILDAATAHIIPTDDQPGARECGVIDYIQNMLSFMPGSDANCDHSMSAADVTATVLATAGARADCPDGGNVDGNGGVDAADVEAAEAAVFNAKPVFGGAPFSGRQAQSHFNIGSQGCTTCHGAAPQTATAHFAAALPTQPTKIDAYPPDFFAEHLPLPRLRRLAWKIRILGAAAVPEASDNPLATSLLEADLRRKYREGLASLNTLSQHQYAKNFPQLTPAQQSAIFDKADQSFIQLLTGHTIEGMLCPPEYGGNRNRIGWQLVGFDGDSQPQGYVVYDPTVPGNFRERTDKPNSSPNPDEDCHGFSTHMNSFLTLISGSDPVKPGKKFSNPYCLDVP